MTATGSVAYTKPGSSGIDLDANDLGLAVGERVIVYAKNGDTTIGHVTAPGIVTVAIGFGSAGRPVRIRRPRP